MLLLKVLIVAIPALGQALDIVTSIYARSVPGTYETNKLLRAPDGGFAIVKGITLKTLLVVPFCITVAFPLSLGDAIIALICASTVGIFTGALPGIKNILFLRRFK